MSSEIVGFDPVEHCYSWNGWNPPSVSHLLTAAGVNAFDPTWWRKALLRKGIKPEQAEQWATDMVWDGIDRQEADRWVAQFVDAPMSPDDAEAYMAWRRDSATSRGSRIHARIEHSFNGSESIPGLLENANLIARDREWFNSFNDFRIESRIEEIIAVEKVLINTTGIFCGTVDFAAEIFIPELGDTEPVRRIIDWKTTYPPEGKVKGKSWQAMQMAAYGATLNRLEGSEIVEAINVHLYPGGYQITRYDKDALIKAWQEFLLHLWNFWQERYLKGLEYHSPQMAALAVERMQQEWMS